MNNFVTFPWLIGTAVGLIGVIYVIFYNAFRSKVDTSFCSERHRNVESILEEIKLTLKNHSSDLANMNKTLARIEITLNNRSH